MTRFFISYRHTHADTRLAKCLHGHLKANGHASFLDVDIPPGSDWAAVIESELRAADVFILFLSAEAIQSDFIRVEVEMAAECAKRPERPLKILPVRLNFAEPLPYVWRVHLDSIQHIFWNRDLPDSDLAKKLLDAAQNVTSTAPTPSARTTQDLYDATESLGVPMPAAEPEMESGTLKLNSPFYILRPTDIAAQQLADRQGKTLIVKGPRQIGKSSLLARLHARAQEQNRRSLYLDFQLVDQAMLADLSKLFLFLAKKMQRAFRATIKPSDLWDQDLGATDNMTNYIEDALLADGDGQIQLVMDEVDRLFLCPFRDDFFAAIRGWHNRRATATNWDKVNLIVGHSTAPALWIQDINQSPFNVGDPIRLHDFGSDAIAALNRLYGGSLADKNLPELAAWTGGHPYLVRVSLHALRHGHRDLASLRLATKNDGGPYKDHLHAILWSLRNDEGLKKSLRQILSSGRCDEEFHFQRLVAAGLIRGEHRQQANIRCDLYRDYLPTHL